MNWALIKKKVLTALKKYLSSAAVKNALTKLALRSVGLTGFWGIVAGWVIPRLVKYGIIEGRDLIQKEKDKDAAEKYADTISKGKDADEDTKLSDQSDILNGN